MLSSSRPARRALSSQRRRSRRSGPCAASDVVAQRAGDEGADAGTGRDQPGVFQFPVGLEHGVRVDGQLTDDVLDGRQLIARRRAARAAARAAPAAPVAGYGGTPERLSR